MGEAAEGLLDVDLRLRLNRLGRLNRLRLERYRPRRQGCVLSRG